MSGSLALYLAIAAVPPQTQTTTTTSTSLSNISPPPPRPPPPPRTLADLLFLLTLLFGIDFSHVPSISRIIKRRRRSLPPSLAVPRTSLARSLARPIHTMVSTHPSVAVIAFTTQRWQSLTLCVRYECRGSSCAATSMRPSGCSRRSRSSPRSYVLERHSLAGWLAGWLAGCLIDRLID